MVSRKERSSSKPSRKLYFLSGVKRALVMAAAGLFLYGCAGNTGQMAQRTGTDVSLKENNYKVIKAGAKGESSGFSLLGFIPIVSPNFADAKESLYKSVGQNLEGRSVALANMTEDKSTLYLVLFSIPRYTITADIVEFDKASSSQK